MWTTYLITSVQGNLLIVSKMSRLQRMWKHWFWILLALMRGHCNCWKLEENRNKKDRDCTKKNAVWHCDSVIGGQNTVDCIKTEHKNQTITANKPELF